LSTIYDEVLLATKHKKELEYIYADNSKVKLRQVSNDRQAQMIPMGYKPVISGIHRGNYQNDIPFVFYRDSEVNEEFFWSYFHIPDTKESMDLYSQYKDKEYIIVHNETSNGKLFDISDVLKHYGKDVVIVDVSKLMKPIVHYKDLLINASGLYLSNSCIFCLALNLELKTDKCYYISRYNEDYSYLYKNIGSI